MLSQTSCMFTIKSASRYDAVARDEDKTIGGSIKFIRINND